MPASVIDELSGTIDGVNKVFTTPAAYKTGSVVIFINGQLKRRDDDDGWTELGSNQIELKEAPRDCDTVHAGYIPI